MSNTIYVFECPVHGGEIEVFCFRAFLKENRNGWKKLKTTYVPVAFDDGELDKMLAKLTATASKP